MTDLMQINNPQTMTSLELRDIINTVRREAGEPEIRLNKLNEKIADELEGDHYTKSVVKNNNGTESEVYNLTTEQCSLVGMRESKYVRRNVLAKLKELESQQPSFNIPTTLSGALQLAADQALQIEQQEQQLALAAPKVEFYDAVTQSDDAISIGEVAKTLNVKGMGQNKLFKLLRDKGVLQTGGSRHNQPYQKHVDAGRFRLVETSWVAGNGDVRVNMKTVVLQKGLDYIRKLIEA